MLTMASEPWPPSDVGKRTSWTESRETLPCTMPTRWGATKFAGPDAGHTEREGRGLAAQPGGVAALENSGKSSNLLGLEGPARLSVP